MPVISSASTPQTATTIGRTHPAGGPLMTRRRVLQLTAASALGVTLGACGRGSSASPEDPTKFWQVIADAAQRQDPTLTRRAAEADLAAIGGRTALRRPSLAHRRAIQQRITDDFATGRTVLVQGWLLARAEVSAAIVIAERSR